MRATTVARSGLATLVAIVLACGPSAAQTPDHPDGTAIGRVTFGAEATAVASPPDHDAFFNSTDYGQNDLRMGRLRLIGEWRLSDRVSFLGEVRAENGDGVTAAAWYLRWRPWPAHDFDLQIGRIPPVIGVFARQPYGRDNPLIGTPLAYQYLTSLRPDALPATIDDLVAMRAQGWRASYPVGSTVPASGVALVSAFEWDTGVEAHWHHGWFDGAGAVTRGAAAVPEAGSDRTPGLSWSGRVAVRGPAGLTAGLSAERGPWIDSSVLSRLPTGTASASDQTVLGADVEFGWGRWLVRGEELHATFDLPLFSRGGAPVRLGALSSFIEARYRILPRWQVAARLEQLDFSSVHAESGLTTPWDAPVERSEIDLGFRVLRNFELRAGWQMNWRDGGVVSERSYPAAELLYWF